MTCARTLLYSALVRICFLLSSAFDLYGRPAMIFSATSSVTPGRVISSSLLALFRSIAGWCLECEAMCALGAGFAAVASTAYAAIGRIIATARADRVRNLMERIMMDLL